MYGYRQILLRMRSGKTDRALSKAGLMGRRKLGEARRLVASSGWLDPARPLPDDAGALAVRLSLPFIHFPGADLRAGR